MKLRTGTAEEAAMDPARVERIRQRIAEWAPRLSALEIVAARRGVVFLHETHGRTRPESDAPPLTETSRFPIQSVTKPFTATALMMLVEDGLVEVHRPVQFYIPEFAGEGKLAVTLHHLLTHTSGLDDDALEVNRFLARNDPEATLEPTEHPAVHRYIGLACGVPLSYSPGSEHLYCNANYALLLKIVRRVSGQAPVQFMQDRIFGPLGMTHTSLGLPEDLEGERVYWPEHAPLARSLGGPDRPFLAGLNESSTLFVPIGFFGMFSTGSDLATFGQAFLNGGRYGDVRLLSRDTASLMTRNHTSGLKGRLLMLASEFASVGYGWFVQDDARFPFVTPALGTPRSYSHTGYGGLYLWVDPVQELVIAFLSTQDKVWEPIGYIASERELLVNMVTSAVAD